MRVRSVSPRGRRCTARDDRSEAHLLLRGVRRRDGGFRRPMEARNLMPADLRGAARPTEPLSAGSRPLAEGPNPEVRGKFLVVGDTTFHVRGVTYGAFRPDEHDREYRDLDVIDADFAQMAANG